MTSQRFANRLFRSSLIYSLVGILNAGLSFSLLPVYSRNIPAAEYGAFSLLLVVMVLCEAFLNLGANGALLQVLFKGTDEPLRKRIINTVFWFSLIFPVAFLPAYLLLREWLVNTLVGPIANGPHYLDLAVINGYFLCEITVGNAVLRLREQAGRLATCSFFQNLSKVIAITYLVRFAHWGISGILVGSIFSSVLGFLLTCGPLFKVSTSGWSLPHLKKVLLVSAPLMPAWLVNWALTFLDKFCLKQFHGLHDVGIYAMAMQLASILNIALTTPFSMALHSLLFATEDQEGVREEYAKVMDAYLEVGTCLYVLFVTCSVELYYFFISSDYVNGLVLIPVIALGPFFTGLSSVTQCGAMLRRKNYNLLGIGIGVYLFTLLITVSLVRGYGLFGAAVATTISNATTALSYYVLSQRVFPLPYSRRKAVTVFAAMAIFMLVFYTTGTPFAQVKTTPLETMLFRSAGKLCVLVASLFVLYRFRIAPGFLGRRKLQTL